MMAATLRLRCPNCKREVDALREDYDPKSAVVGLTLCPECLDRLNGRDPETWYLDKDGNEITEQPTHPGAEL